MDLGEKKLCDIKVQTERLSQTKLSRELNKLENKQK